MTLEEYKEGYTGAVEQNKKLQLELYRSDRFIYVGRHWYDSNLKELRELRQEITATNKKLQSARDYLEQEHHIYLSDITGKVYEESESPLYREKVLRRITEEKLKKERDDRDLDKAVYEANTSRLNKELFTVGQERDELRKQLDEARRYFKSLQDAGIVK